MFVLFHYTATKKRAIHMITLSSSMVSHYVKYTTSVNDLPIFTLFHTIALEFVE